MCGTDISPISYYCLLFAANVLLWTFALIHSLHFHSLICASNLIITITIILISVTCLINRLFIAFAVWAGATFGVLLCMDVLECFLHALRLHWVRAHVNTYQLTPYPYPYPIRSWFHCVLHVSVYRWNSKTNSSMLMVIYMNHLLIH
jgi:hypothetical protein